MASRTFRTPFGYNDFVLRRKPLRQPGQDLRDVATYTIPEAAAFLAIPQRTMFDWFQKPYLLKPSAMYGEIALLSFRDISEAYILEILRNVYGFRLRALTEILANARKETKLKRPLIEADLGVVFGKLVLVKAQKGKVPRRDVDLAYGRNLVLSGLLDIAGKRLPRDNRHAPMRLYPWRLMSQSDDSTPITVDPDIMSGRAVISGTRIPITLVMGMKKRGKTAADIARNYNLKHEVVEKAIQHLERPIQKVA